MYSKERIRTFLLLVNKDQTKFIVKESQVW